MPDHETLGLAISAVEQWRGASGSRVVEIRPPGATLRPSHDLEMVSIADSRGRYMVIWQRIRYHERDIMFGEVTEIDEHGPMSPHGRLLVRVEDDGEVVVAPDPRTVGGRISHNFATGETWEEQALRSP